MPRLLKAFHRFRAGDASGLSALGTIAAAAVILYLFLIPRDLWLGLLPSHDLIPASDTPQAHLERDLLDSLQGNFTKIYSVHQDGRPPVPLHSQPQLTDAQRKRYAHLRAAKSKYLLTTNTINIAGQLPDLLNTIAVLTNFLGPERISISIIEGPSGDSTPYVLDQVLRPLLSHLRVPSSAVRIITNAPKIDFSEVNRIEALANLRNEAIKPLWEQDPSSTVGDNVGAIVFFNDVYLQASDILELLHQHRKAGQRQKTGITAAWDWLSRDPDHYYDVWVGRTIDTGDLFYPIDGDHWQPSSELFPNSPASREAYNNLEPFQVYSAWNALAVLSPEPFKPPYNVRFRRGGEGECASSECQLVASDFWKHGWGRVQVVPSVQLAYDESTARKTVEKLRERQAYLGWEGGVPPRERDTVVSWVKDPPREVRCNAWPEVFGLSANVWEKTTWVPPFV